MKNFTIYLTRNLLKILLISPLLLASPSSLAKSFEKLIEVSKQQKQVAFIPFANDFTLSAIILKDLNKTELKVNSQDLPQQLHRSSELLESLPIWQNLGISYLVVGSTRTDCSKVIIDYEVIDTNNGQVIQGRQKLSADDDIMSMRYAAHIIADKVYELITDTMSD